MTITLPVSEERHGEVAVGLEEMSARTCDKILNCGSALSRAAVPSFAAS